MMKKLLLLSTTCFLLSASAQAGLYKWTDESGNVHFSDKMSASVSQRVHTKIGSHGVVEKEIDPEAIIRDGKSKEAELKQHELDEIKQARVEREIRRILAEKQRRDEHLLLTYNSKDELISFFENKIKMVKGNSNIFQTHNDVLKKKVAKLIQQKKAVKQKKTITSINKKIVRINSSIEQYNKALKENSKELLMLSKNYQIDMKRYTELTQ